MMAQQVTQLLMHLISKYNFSVCEWISLTRMRWDPAKVLVCVLIYWSSHPETKTILAEQVNLAANYKITSHGTATGKTVPAPNKWDAIGINWFNTANLSPSSSLTI